MGSAFNNKEEYDTSLEYLNKAKQIYLSTLGSEHPNAKSVLGWIDDVRDKQQRQASSSETQQMHEEVVAVSDGSDGTEKQRNKCCVVL